MLTIQEALRQAISKGFAAPQFIRGVAQDPWVSTTGYAPVTVGEYTIKPSVSPVAPILSEWDRFGGDTRYQSQNYKGPIQGYLVTFKAPNGGDVQAGYDANGQLIGQNLQFNVGGGNLQTVRFDGSGKVIDSSVWNPSGYSGQLQDFIVRGVLPLAAPVLGPTLGASLAPTASAATQAAIGSSAINAGTALATGQDPEKVAVSGIASLAVPGVTGALKDVGLPTTIANPLASAAVQTAVTGNAPDIEKLALSTALGALTSAGKPSSAINAPNPKDFSADALAELSDDATLPSGAGLAGVGGTKIGATGVTLGQAAQGIGALQAAASGNIAPLLGVGAGLASSGTQTTQRQQNMPQSTKWSDIFEELYIPGNSVASTDDMGISWSSGWVPEYVKNFDPQKYRFIAEEGGGHFYDGKPINPSQLVLNPYDDQSGLQNIVEGWRKPAELKEPYRSLANPMVTINGLDFRIRGDGTAYREDGGVVTQGFLTKDPAGNVTLDRVSSYREGSGWDKFKDFVTEGVLPVAGFALGINALAPALTGAGAAGAGAGASEAALNALDMAVGQGSFAPTFATTAPVAMPSVTTSALPSGIETLSGYNPDPDILSSIGSEFGYNPDPDIFTPSSGSSSGWQGEFDSPPPGGGAAGAPGAGTMATEAPVTPLPQWLKRIQSGVADAKDWASAADTLKSAKNPLDLLRSLTGASTPTTAVGGGGGGGGGFGTMGNLALGIGALMALGKLAKPPSGGPSLPAQTPIDLTKYKATLPQANVYKPRYAEGGIASLNQPDMVVGGNPLNTADASEFDWQQRSNPVLMMAGGGISTLGSYSDGGRLLKGPGDGMSDNIPATIADKRPARLADGEFVVPADVVSHLGNGSTDAGAKQLYAMMDRVRKARTGNKKQGKQINPSKFTPA